MRVQELAACDWSSLESKACLTTVFHDLQWLTLTSDCLGGRLTLYICEDASGSWIASCYSGQVWTKVGFRIGGIGYGGPLPLHPVPTAQFLFDGCSQAVFSIATHRQEICSLATAFPHGAWVDVSKTAAASLDWSCIASLNGPADDFFEQRISGKKRSAVKKAQRLGVEVRDLTEDDLGDVHYLIECTQRRVGASYTTPRELLRRILAKGIDGVIGKAAVFNGAIISVAILLTRGRNGFLLFHGWNRAYATLNANELLYWRLMEAAFHCGVVNFDLGRSHSTNLLESKIRWGAAKTPVLQFTNVSPSTPGAYDVR